MLSDHGLREGNQNAVRTLVAFDLGFLAKRAFPQIGTHGLISALPSASAFETLRIHIAATVKQVPVERYSVRLRAFLRERCAWERSRREMEA